MFRKGMGTVWQRTKDRIWSERKQWRGKAVIVSDDSEKKKRGRRSRRQQDGSMDG